MKDLYHNLLDVAKESLLSISKFNIYHLFMSSVFYFIF